MLISSKDTKVGQNMEGNLSACLNGSVLEPRSQNELHSGSFCGFTSKCPKGIPVTFIWSRIPLYGGAWHHDNMSDYPFPRKLRSRESQTCN